MEIINISKAFTQNKLVKKRGMLYCWPFEILWIAPFGLMFILLVIKGMLISENSLKMKTALHIQIDIYIITNTLPKTIL